ncbi:MAG: ABC transporter permease [Candidatus Scatomorpha sp.]|jgi:ABC-type transport system involved in multi-copper enzyme maturation permease subunit
MSSLNRNEVSKLRKRKVLIFILIAYIIFSMVCVHMYNKIIAEGKISNFDSNEFVELFSTDFLNKPFLPIGPIIIGLALLDVFISDYASGNMKFQVMKVDNRKKFILSKLFTQLISYFILAWIMFLISQIAGLIFFDVNLTLSNFFSSFLIYNLNILPSLAVINIANLIFAISGKENITRISIIVLFIVLGIIARATSIGHLLPVLNYTYLLRFFDSEFEFKFLYNQLVSLIYLILFIFININVWSKKEYC